MYILFFAFLTDRKDRYSWNNNKSFFIFYQNSIKMHIRLFPNFAKKKS